MDRPSWLRLGAFFLLPGGRVIRQRTEGRAIWRRAPIGVEQTASGYEVAWKVTGADQYTVWNTDSSGNYVSNLIGTVSGSSYVFESFEASFQQDLNGDGVVGLAVTRGELLRAFPAQLPA